LQEVYRFKCKFCGAEETSKTGLLWWDSKKCKACGNNRFWLSDKIEAKGESS